MDLPYTFIIRPSAEIGLKTPRKRMIFLRKLEANLNLTFNRAGLAIKLRHGVRIYFLETSDSQRARALLKRVFGISSFSPVELKCQTDLATICAEGEKKFSDIVRGRTFSVRSRRFGAQKFSTRDVEIQLGARLAPHGKVKLIEPEITIGVELHNRQTLMYWEKIPGAKGFPSGTQNRALALMSGGYDSPVAAWRVMRRGVNVDFVFFNMSGKAYERQVLQIVKILVEGWAVGQSPKLFIVDFNDVVKNLKENVKESYRQVILKRLMVRGAEMIAKEIGAQALITGESIAQVSSQTLPNLDAISSASRLQVLRPLITSEKEEIISQAETIATAFLSEKVQEHCSITRGSPVLFAKPKKVKLEESKTDPLVLETAVINKKYLDVFALEPGDLHRDYLTVDGFDSSDVLVDCQPTYLYRTWHFKNALHIDPDKFAEKALTLDKKTRYVLYCTHGTQTPALAEFMQRHGFEAYAFKGGVRELKTISN